MSDILLWPPLTLDVTTQPWWHTQAEAIIAVNMIHIPSWTAITGLMADAGATTRIAAVLLLYDSLWKAASILRRATPRLMSASQRAICNRAREVNALTHLAILYGIKVAERVTVPANNISLNTH